MESLLCSPCKSSGASIQPSKSSPCASVWPSGQQPYFEDKQLHPARFGPVAAVLPSEQQPNSEYAQPQPNEIWY